MPATAREFVRTVTARDDRRARRPLPVRALPVDGTYPSGTAAWEKRNVSDFVASWDPEICIQCGNCGFICPHSVIRAKLYEQDRLRGAPATFKCAPLSASVCRRSATRCRSTRRTAPAAGFAWRSARSPPRDGAHQGDQHGRQPRSRSRDGQHRVLRDSARRPVAAWTSPPCAELQFLEPLFEFSGACAGCGETPYLKLLSQLFGDRLLVANATGCSSIYGGNLPTTPWTHEREGRGPAWSNSLFEDNAEFGLGFRLVSDRTPPGSATLSTTRRLRTNP